MNDSARGNKHKDANKESDKESLTEKEPDQFQAVHMECVTTAFAEELKALRKE